MRVLGIDPGLRRTGWGVIDSAGARISHVANGICSSDGDDLAVRVSALLRDPDALARMTGAARRFIAGQDDQLDGIAARLIKALKLEPPS